MVSSFAHRLLIRHICSILMMVLPSLGYAADLDYSAFAPTPPIGWNIGIKCTISGPYRLTRFTHDEQRTLMSLWSRASSPLVLGCNLTDLDDWTLSLLTNDEVLAIDHDSLGLTAKRISRKDGVEVWVKDLKDSSRAMDFPIAPKLMPKSRPNGPTRICPASKKFAIYGRKGIWTRCRIKSACPCPSMASSCYDSLPC